MIIKNPYSVFTPSQNSKFMSRLCNSAILVSTSTSLPAPVWAALETPHSLAGQINWINIYLIAAATKHSTTHFRNQIEHKTNNNYNYNNNCDNISLSISGDLVTNSIRKLCTISESQLCTVIGAIKSQTAADTDYVPASISICSFNSNSLGSSHNNNNKSNQLPMWTIINQRQPASQKGATTVTVQQASGERGGGSAAERAFK